VPCTGDRGDEPSAALGSQRVSRGLARETPSGVELARQAARTLRKHPRNPIAVPHPLCEPRVADLGVEDLKNLFEVDLPDYDRLLVGWFPEV
jgi:hypothetical protein